MSFARKIERKQSPKYSCCFTTYFDDDPNIITRTTTIVTNLKSNEIVEKLESSEVDDPNEVCEKAVILAKKYNCKITLMSEPVKNQKCSCGNCNGHLDNFISKENYRDIRKANLLKNGKK